jgi:hypothetical protein
MGSGRQQAWRFEVVNLKNHEGEDVGELETRLFRCTDCDREFSFYEGISEVGEP